MRLDELLTEVRDLCEPRRAGLDRYVGLEQIPPGTLHVARTLPNDEVASTTKRFRSGDILFGTLRPYFRKVARAPFDGICSTDITVLRPVREHDAGFAFYAIADPTFIAYASATSNGTRMPRAKWSVVSGYTVPDLSPSRRQRIGYTLSVYDDLIETNTRRIALLEEMARALYLEWLVDFRFPGHKTAELVSGRHRRPTGWTPTALGDHVTEVRDPVDPTEVEPSTPYFGLEHLPRRSTTLTSWGFASEVQSTKLRVRVGDVLFGKIRPYFHKVGISPVDAVSSSDAIVVRAKRHDLRAAVLACMSSDDFVAKATAASQGTKMPRANWDVMRGYPLPVPPEPLLRQYNDAAWPLVEAASNYGLRNRTLAATRDLLLPRLVSGEIELAP